MMLKFVSKAFSSLLGIVLWVNLIFWVLGGFIGLFAATDSNFGLGLLGLILGAVIGLLSNIVFGGVLVVFVNLSKEIADIKEEVKKITAKAQP